MPPQQGDRLLDVFDAALDFGTQGKSPLRPIWRSSPDL
jgi:hypothetical protein